MLVKRKLSFFTNSWTIITKILLKDTHRTRVYIIHNNQAIVVKDRLGDGSWKLPGGGMKKGEKPKECAAREIYEELRIKVDLKDLVFLETVKPTEHLPFYKEILKVTLKEKPDIKINKLELSDARWFDIKELPEIGDEVINQSIKII